MKTVSGTHTARNVVARLAISPEEAATALGISRDTFDREVRHELRIVRIGRRVVVPVKELERYLERNATRAFDVIT
jgi:excisionase family DNA binding protein